MRPFSEVPLISNLSIFSSLFFLFCSSFAIQDSGMTPSWLMLGCVGGGKLGLVNIVQGHEKRAQTQTLESGYFPVG